MSKYLFSLALLTLGPFASAQDKTILENPWHYGLSIGYIYQADNFVTLGGVIAKNPGNFRKRGVAYGLATEFNLRKNDPVIGAKAFYEVTLIAFGLRLNSITYFKGSATDFRFTPEIGLTANGLYNIYYGYSIPLGSKEFEEISRSRLNVTFNLFRGLKFNGEPRR